MTHTHIDKATSRCTQIYSGKKKKKEKGRVVAKTKLNKMKTKTQSSTEGEVSAKRNGLSSEFCRRLGLGASAT